MSQEEYKVKRYDFITPLGVKMTALVRVETSDYNCVNSSLHEDEYGFADLDLKDGDVIVDVGAHIGGEALYFASLCKKFRYIAYEPIPENMSLLKTNLTLNSDYDQMDITLWNVAIGDKNKDKVKVSYGDMADKGGYREHFMGNLRGIATKGYAKVRQANLAQIFKENKINHIKLLKMDMEGGERKLFSATDKKILKKVDNIVGEYHYTSRERLLKALGGQFIDADCPHKTDKHVGHFRFENINICEQ